MLKFIRFWIVCAVVFFSGNVAHAQTTVNLSPTKDAYVNSQAPSQNYGGSTTMQVGTTSGKGWQYHQRGFVAFDLSSIPSNAIIYSATLSLYVQSVTGTAPSWHIKRVESSWIESGTGSITASFQPSITTNTNDWVSTGSQAGSPHVYDMKNMVQRMVYGQIQNYGWSIQVQNEALAATSYEKFYSKEYGTSGLRPKLTVVWFYPPTLSSVNVTHESAPSASDGGVDFVLNGQISTYVDYEWIDGSGTVLASGTGSPTPVFLVNVPYGWYGFHIKGTTYNEELYMAFLVGLECKEVTIEFDPDANYMDNAMNTNLVLGGVDYGDYNYGNQSTLTTYYKHTTGQKLNSFLKMKLWVDDALTLNQADLTLQGQSHSGSSNVSEFDLVDGAWNETLISWNNSPTTTSSTTVAIPQTYSTTEDKVIDMTDFWDVWKANNATNYGVVFQMLPTSSDNQQYYHSPTATTPADRPVVEFKVRLGSPYECSNLYFYPKAEIEESVAFVSGDKVRFRFEEDYYDATGNLDYVITLLEDDTQQIGTLTKNHLVNWFELQDGVGGLTFSSGKVYLLQVINQKGQKMYLKFKMS